MAEGPPKGKEILWIVMIPAVAALNYVTGVIVNTLKLPLFLDTWATSFGVLIGGLLLGATGGFLYNIIMAFTLWGLPAWVWGFSNLFIAAITWLVMKWGLIDFQKPLKIVAAGIISGIGNSFVCLAISWIAFGLLPTYPATAPIYALFLAWSGGNMVIAALGQSLAVEWADKTIALIMAVYAFSAIPKRFLLTRK